MQDRSNPRSTGAQTDVLMTYIPELRCWVRRDFLAGSEGQPGWAAVQKRSYRRVRKFHCAQADNTGPVCPALVLIGYFAGVNAKHH